MKVSRQTFGSIAASFLACCIVLTVFTCRAEAQAPASARDTSTLTVRITGIRNASGKIRVSLQRDSNLVEERVVEIDAKTMTAQATFDKLPQGVYAVTAIHDENMNGKLDFDSAGMPLEGYGHSNNPEKRMGPPSYEETTFPAKQPQVTTEIKLIYWP